MGYHNMVDYDYLARFRKENLEDSLIAHLAESLSINYRLAMDIYYKSRMAKEIEKGIYDIDNWDYKYFVNILIENEPELFAGIGDK